MYLEGEYKTPSGVSSSSEQRPQISLDTDHMKCNICLNIWHDVVTVAPCFHNFCNGCFSEWLRRSQQKSSAVICPQCRTSVQFVGRNHFLFSITEEILNSNVSLKRSEEEIAYLDSSATIHSNLVITNKKSQARKRRMSDELLELSCPQCNNCIGGFLCDQSTIHIRCEACHGMMPSRTNLSVPQHCIGCDKIFCGAYWHNQRISRSDFHPLCGEEILKQISERSCSTIPLLAHEKNIYEQDVTKRCIMQLGKTVRDVVSEWIHLFNNREIDRANLSLLNAEMITSTSYVCSQCFEKLVCFLLYWFRISLPKHVLPTCERGREDCWYGYSCRTQHHSAEHAQRRNHVCRPTRTPGPTM